MKLPRTFALAAVALVASCVAASAEGLLIVAPRALSESLTDFVAYKKTRLPTELVTLEDALAKATGVDDAEKLKRFLYDKWRAEKTAYVLLAGDADLLPVRYMVLDRIRPKAFNYSFYPSDLYYADLAKKDGAFEDWNAQKDDFHAGYFGEVRGEKNKDGVINFDAVDYLPDVAVGRWPVSTPEQARAVAAKTIAAEKQRAARKDEKPKAALIASTGWIDTRRPFDALEKALGDGWQLERRLFQKETKGRPNEAALMEIWNAGQDLILHAGHGQPAEWEQCFSSRAMAKLTNRDRVPVIFSAGCSTAYFSALAPYDDYVDVAGVEHIGCDAGEVFAAPPPPPANYQRGKFNKTGMGEELVRRAEGGAIAYMGCNTGSQPCGLTLQRGFVEAAAKPGTRLGDAWKSAYQTFHERERLAELKPDPSWYPPSIFFQGMKFMLFGDPSFEM